MMIGATPKEMNTQNLFQTKKRKNPKEMDVKIKKGNSKK
jgi:hypothetical protein